MTWFWNPCLQEPEKERWEICQDNWFWGGGSSHSHGIGQCFSGHVLLATFWWATFWWATFWVCKVCRQIWGKEQLHLLGKLRSNLLQLATIQGSEKETTWKMLRRSSLCFESIKVAFDLRLWHKFCYSVKIANIFAMAPGRRINRNGVNCL